MLGVLARTLMKSSEILCYCHLFIASLLGESLAKQ